MPHGHKDIQTTTSVVPAAYHPVSAGIAKPAVIPVQRKEKNDDDPVSLEPDAAVQMKEFKLPASMADGRSAVMPFQLRPNNTGLPDNLKSGIENLSGLSMDDVSVHYNSSRPPQLQALAFAQGTDIHVAPGQERHLPHEAWHVVQQKQGRVNATMQMKGGVNVNDDAGLEREADIMGDKALFAGNGYTGNAYNGTAYTGNGYTGSAYPGNAYTDNGSTGNAGAGSPFTGNLYAMPPLQRQAVGDVIQMLPASKVTFGMTRIGGFETPEKMDADPLSRQPGSTVGSKPKDGQQGRLISLLQRERPGAYAAGHLLNQEFHGPGDHRNLVPLTYATNNLMANTIEQFVRSYFRRDEVVAYQVRVNYGVPERKTIRAENALPESLDFRLIPQEERSPGEWNDKRGVPPIVINIKHQLPPDEEPHGKAPSKRAEKGAHDQQNFTLLSMLSSSSGSKGMDESKDEAKDDAIILPPNQIKEFERKSIYQPLFGLRNWFDRDWLRRFSGYQNEEELLTHVSGELKHKDLKQGTIPLGVAIKIVTGQKIEMIGDVKDRNVDDMLQGYVEQMLDRYTNGVPENAMEGIILDVKGLIMDQHAITVREDYESELLREIEAEHDRSGAVGGPSGGSLGGLAGGPGSAVKGMDLEEDSEKPQAKPKEKRKQYSFTYQRSFFLPTNKDRITNANLYKLKAAIDAGVNDENAASVYEMIKIVHAGLTECTADAEPGTPSPFDEGRPPSYSKQYYEAVMLVWKEIFNSVSNAGQLPAFSRELTAWIAQVAGKAGRLF